MGFIMKLFKGFSGSPRQIETACPPRSDEKIVAIVKNQATSPPHTPDPADVLAEIEREMLENLYKAYTSPQVLSVKADLRLSVYGNLREVSIEVKKDSARQLSIIVALKQPSIVESESSKESVLSFIVRPGHHGLLHVVNESVSSSIEDEPKQASSSSTVYTIPAISIDASFPTVPPSPSPSSLLIGNQTDATLIQQGIDLHREVIWLKKLGEGGFGAVFAVQHKTTGRFSAVKVLVKEDISRRRMFLNEQRVMRMVGDHPFLAALEASCHDDWGMYLVNSYCPGGDMDTELDRVGQLCESRMKFYSSQLILAIEHLHKHHIIHRDIKPANILLDACGNAVLADMGLCHIFERSKPTTPDTWNPGTVHSSTLDDFDDAKSFVCYGLAGTLGYSAPEVISNCGYSFSADIWSLGVTLYQMRCGRLPWSGLRDGLKDRMTLINQSLTEPVTFDYRDKVSQNLQNALQWMIHKNPERRAGIGRIKGMRFFRAINWKKMAKAQVKAPFVPPQCTTLPRASHLDFLPLGTPYTPEEDPFPEFNYRSPLLDRSSIPSPITISTPGVLTTLLGKFMPRAPVQWEMVKLQKNQDTHGGAQGSVHTKLFSSRW